MASERRDALPLIYLRGTHYEVGYDMGRLMSGPIKTMMHQYQPLNNDYLPIYETQEGRQVYKATLEAVKLRFPRYLSELQGIADGAQVPFYKLFLIHMDDILPCTAKGISSRNTNGCSTLCMNEPDNELLGHTEDGFSGAMNNCFLVQVEIPESDEKFCSFCYAGYLPGYAMNYNKHGLVFTLNVISAKQMAKAKTPRTFLCRSLLSARNLDDVETILRDKGCGVGDAMSVNLTFLNQEGDRLFHNIEVAPALPPNTESALSVLTISPGEQSFHCNKYLRLKVPEAGGAIMHSSDARMEVYNKKKQPRDKEELLELLADSSHPRFTIFRDEEPIKTLAIGIFDFIDRTWSIYLDDPTKVSPLVVLPLSLK